MNGYSLSQNDLIRDFIWLISSPSIIQGIIEDRNWTSSQFWLQQRDQLEHLMLDSNTASNALHTLLKQQTDQRLGHRFETLLSYYFNASERYQILAQNLQIQTQQRTIGEFDFVIKDTQLNQTQHWEVACKFYLGLGNT